MKNPNLGMAGMKNLIDVHAPFRVQALQAIQAVSGLLQQLSK